MKNSDELGEASAGDNKDRIRYVITGPKKYLSHSLVMKALW